jgi:hypothetical protein
MFKKILIGLAVLIVIFVGIVFTRPDTFHVERSATMPAPPAAIYPLINDFHRWSEWSPWDKLDPAMKKDYEGTSGVGAKYHWVGNDKVGEGRMTITDTQPSDKVVIQLEFMKPFEATNVTTFTLLPSAVGTQVRWAMDGPQNFMAKAFSLFMNMDQMIGKDFESGLSALSALSATEAQKLAAAADVAKKAAEAAAAAASPSPAPAVVPAPAKPAKKK